MVDLSGVPFALQADAVEDAKIGRVGEGAAQVEGHLLLGTLACADERIGGCDWVEFFDDHALDYRRHDANVLRWSLGEVSELGEFQPLPRLYRRHSIVMDEPSTSLGARVTFAMTLPIRLRFSAPVISSARKTSPAHRRISATMASES